MPGAVEGVLLTGLQLRQRAEHFSFQERIAAVGVLLRLHSVAVNRIGTATVNPKLQWSAVGIRYAGKKLKRFHMSDAAL